MGWFTKSKKPVEALPPPEEELWIVCSSCKAHIFKQEWDKNLQVCPKCNFHEKLTCYERIHITLDEKTFREFNAEISTSDPIQFSDAAEAYKDKAEATKTKVGLKESVVTGSGKIKDITVTVAVMDFRFLGGSLGSGAGEKILLAADYALRHSRPYIVFSASGGARMHEGIISLMQMPKTCAGIARLHRAGIPYISVLTHPTTGGVSASYAMVGDLNIAEPGALIGFAGRRVIEQTIKQELPNGFQTAEYLLEHGFVDQIVHRKDMKDFLASVLRYWQRR
ncbi:MAG: acetyl-CoA carboxylase, carboxyltransferase subunit beta [Verrucomicrobiota bacterium]|nr:acetyl-CoA carboxylase, carboxyltransferase subunit beta [Verrucomicrobiota bacterium]